MRGGGPRLLGVLGLVGAHHGDGTLGAILVANSETTVSENTFGNDVGVFSVGPGLPAYGEDSHATAQLRQFPAAILGHDRYACDNDMVCGWAGSLACADGINIVAGTGSIANRARGRRPNQRAATPSNALAVHAARSSSACGVVT